MRCLQPINVGGKLMPCGKCPACLTNKKNEWVFRLNEELKVSPYSYFFTLTYRDNDLSYICSVPYKVEFPCLNKRDVQLFLKRLRKNTKIKFKYHICAEYGPNTLRPHYHGILFSQKPLDLVSIMNAWQHSDLVDKVFEPVGSRSAAGYVAKYICKAIFLPDYLRESDRYIKPFSLSSKGLGLTYLECNSQLVEKKISQNEDYVVIDGHKQSMPRYYRNKLFTPEQRAIINDKKSLDIFDKNNKDFLVFCDQHNLDPYDNLAINKYKIHRNFIYSEQMRKMKKYSKYNSKDFL